jgi:hypothetical protein
MWLDAFFQSAFKQIASGGTLVTGRPTINFIGLAVADNAAQQRTDVTGIALANDLGGSMAAPAVVQITGSAGQIPIFALCTTLGASTTTPVPAFIGGVTTTNATTTAVPTNLGTTLPLPDNTVADVWGGIIGRNHANNGDCFACTYNFAYQRFGGAAPSVVRAFATSNVATIGGASGWGTPSLTVSGNNLVINVTGLAATTIDWSVTGQAQERS